MTRLTVIDSREADLARRRTVYAKTTPQDKSCKRCDKEDPSLNNRRRLCSACRDDKGTTHFVAIDGEAMRIFVGHADSLPDIVDDYVLLGVGQDQYEASNDGRPRWWRIQWWQAFRFMYDRFLEDQKAAYVGFFLHYDFIQMLSHDAGIPWGRAAALLKQDDKVYKSRQRTRSGNNHTPMPVEATGADGQRWQFDLLPPARRLKLRPKDCECQNTMCKHMKGIPWMYVCDAGPFFQGESLLTLIDPGRPRGKDADPICTPDEYAAIKRGKEARDSAVLDDDMRYYNRLENEIFARIMDRVNMGFKKAGIYLNRDQWFGPGQAAQEWMLHQRELTLREKSNVPDFINRLAKKTYVGGWMEIPVHGIVPGITYEYDRNSAYPAVIATLPCLEHGHWISGTGKPPRLKPGRLRMVHVHVKGDNQYLGALPYRLGIEEERRLTERLSFIDPVEHKGSVLRPRELSGWFWQHEVNAARKAGLIWGVEYTPSPFESDGDQTWWEYEPCSCKPPLRGIAGMYDERQRIIRGAGTKDTWEALVLKLVYNSVYGKFAQSDGKPRYANPVYASLITAGCRIAILEAIVTHPQGAAAVVMIATDGVYFRTPHPGLIISDNLGEWSVKTKTNLTLFKPGVYWDQKILDALAEGKEVRFKSRGVSAKYFSREIGGVSEMFDTWEPNGSHPFPMISFKSDFSVITLLQALQGKNGRKWSDSGRAVRGKMMYQDSTPITKRIPLLQYDNRVIKLTDEQKTMMGISELRYQVYRSGVMSVRNLETAPYAKAMGYPDEDKEFYGITDDGSVLMSWRQMILE